MNLHVVLEHRFLRSPDGAVWTQTMFAHRFWQRYLEVFDHVTVVARVSDAPAAPAGYLRADGVGVSFAALPYYVGPLRYALMSSAVRRGVRRALRDSEAVVLRLPGVLGSLAHEVLRSAGRPYGVEVVGDPHDVFAPGAVRTPLRPYLRWSFARRLRQQCAEAAGAAYVTAAALQKRYPAGAKAFCTHYSDVELGDDAYRPTPRAGARLEEPTLVTVGSLEQLYKAPDVLIDAVALCHRSGLKARLNIVGDGRHRRELEARAEAAGLGKQVRFLGQLPSGGAVRAELDRADVFVLPSRTEGLSRAMLEAMAAGLPCVGSTAGGIPELLPDEDLVPPNSARALADKILEVASDPLRLERMSRRNLERAHEYHEERLRERRNEFYRFLAAASRQGAGKVPGRALEARP